VGAIPTSQTNFRIDMKDYYIFTENESIKIEINDNILKVDSKWIQKKTFIEQMEKLLERLKQNEKQ